MFESDLSATAGEWAEEADVVIFGSHGPLFKEPYGSDLTLAAHCEVIVSSKGEAAAYLDPTCLPKEGSLWLGQKRMAFGKAFRSIP